MSSCNICDEDYNSMSRMEIECIGCHQSVCKKCAETYIMDRYEDPSCMYPNCNITWNKIFMLNHFSQSFMTGRYKKHREDILFEREKGMMIETQEYAENEAQARRLEKIKQNKNSELFNLREQIGNIMSDINDIDRQIRILRNSTQKTRNTYQYTIRCPSDSCQGFLKSNHVCGICEINVCKMCSQIKNDNHECKQDDIDTTVLLRNETKPCPNCQIPITKAFGCSQMFCTGCKTPFSWITGRIITGEFFHNPEYFRWLNEGGNRNEVFGNENGNGIVNGCDNEQIHWHRIMTRVQRSTTIGSLVSLSNHINDVELPRYTYDMTLENRKNRVSYMLGDITEEKLKKECQKNEKKYEKYVLYYDSLDTMRITINSSINQLLRSDTTGILSIKSLQDLNNDITKIANIINDSFKDISKKYKCVVPFIMIPEKFIIVRNNVNSQDGVWHIIYHKF